MNEIAIVPRTLVAETGHSSWRLRARAILAWTVLAIAAAMSAAEAAEKVVVAVTMIDRHPALEACRDGIRDALKSAGYEDGKSLKLMFESAEGDLTAATEIARRFAREKPDVIVPISTPSAQAVVAATIGTPVVFAAVTDPLGAKLVRDMFQPGGNVTGTSDLAPVKKHIDLIAYLTPGARKIGVLFNPRETNSHTLVYLMKKTAMGANMTIVEAPARASADVAAAARSLVDNADVIFVPTDNTIVSMLDTVIDVATENGVPVFAGDIDSVKRGAIAAIGMDYYNLGRQTGNTIVRVLRGEKPGEIPVVVTEKTNLYVNPGMAAKLGLEIPEDLLSEADEVIR